MRFADVCFWFATCLFVGWVITAIEFTTMRLTYRGWPGNTWIIGVATLVSWGAAFLCFNIMTRIDWLKQELVAKSDGK
jgi:hypothetical protein